MRKTLLKKYKKLFEKQRDELLFNNGILNEEFNVNADDRPDEVDQATSDTEQAMRLRLRNREVLYLKKINQALDRIEDGSFGECEACGEDIEPRRLEARPTAELCLGCKEEEERKEVLTAAGRKHKSLGETFSRRFA